MREIWDLPAQETIKPTGPEWLFRVLHEASEIKRVNMMMILWRIWHNHNEITHDKPCPSIEGSRRFLSSYLDSLFMIKQFPEGDFGKGKMTIDPGAGFRRTSMTQSGQLKTKQRWRPPREGEAKLNVDGAFAGFGRAGAGVVLRDHLGQVILSACRHLPSCRDATEAELCAIEDGLKLSMQWNQLPVTVETDCSEAVELLKEGSPNSSIYAFQVSVIRELLKERNFPLVKVSRDVNMVSHELARLGRVDRKTELWLLDSPEEIARAIAVDCNLVVP
jgi:ribonuclease HI